MKRLLLIIVAIISIAQANAHDASFYEERPGNICRCRFHQAYSVNENYQYYWYIEQTVQRYCQNKYHLPVQAVPSNLAYSNGWVLAYSQLITVTL